MAGKLTDFYDDLIFDKERKDNRLYYAKQGDTDSRGFFVSVHSSGEPLDITSYSMKIKIKKPDGLNVWIDAIRTPGLNKFQIDLTNQALAVPGVARCELELKGLSGQIIKSQDFGLRIDKSNEDGILSENELGDIDRIVDFTKNNLARLELLDIETLENIQQQEDMRLLAETDRSSSEAIRKSEEVTRVANENDRNFGESQRATSETQRISNENDRNYSENIRVIDEGIRKTNETTRQSNESGRVAAETSRANTFANYESRVAGVEAELSAHKLEYVALNAGNRLNSLEEAKVKKYGVRRVLGATTAELERLGDAKGLIALADINLTKHNVVRNDFDSIYPWSNMRKCIIKNDGRVVYQGEAGYSTTVGDYMIEIPSFYLKHTNNGTNLEYWVSEHPLAGYEKIDRFHIARFKTSEVGTVHVSRPKTFPKVSMNRGQFRAKALEKGKGWQLEDLKANYVINVLFKIEFAHLNSQLILGNGVTSVRYTDDDLVQIAEDTTNRVVLLSANANGYNLGEAISIGTTRGNMSGGEYRTITAMNDLLNGTKEIIFDGDPVNVLINYKIYQAGQVSGKTIDLLSNSGSAIGANNRSSISYRGIEDPFGNVWEWIDGALVSDHQGYVCVTPENYGDIVTEHYKPLSYKNSSVDGYAGEMGYDSNYPFAEFTTGITGGSTTKYCDYYYQNVGLCAPIVGGFFNYGVNAGLRHWALNNSPANANISFGARLLRFYRS